MFFSKKYRKKLEQLAKATTILTSRYEEKLQSLHTTISEMESDVHELVEAMNELKQKTDKVDEILENYENFSIEKSLAKKSDEPWAGLSVTEIDPSGRVGLKLDWNDKFQDHLKRSGIPGSTDDDRMSIWFASLVKDLGEEIDEETARTYRDDFE